MSYKNYKWQVIAGDFNSPFIRNYIWTTIPAKYPILFNAPAPMVGIVSKQNDIEYIADMDSWAKTHEALKDQALKDHDFVEKLIDKTNSLGESFNAWSEENIYQADLSTKKAHELTSLLKDFSQKQSDLYAFGVTLPILDFQGFSFVESNLEKFLKEKTLSSEYQKYYEVFTRPLHNSFAQDQEEDLLRLMASFYNEDWAQNIKNQKISAIKELYPDFYKKLEEHTKKHAWVYYVYIGPAFTESGFLAFIKDYIEKGIDPILRLKELDDKKTQTNRLKKEYLEKLNPDPFNKTILNLAGKMVWAKPRRKDYQSRSYFHFEKLLKEIGSRLYLSLSQVRSTPIETLEKALESGSMDANISNSIYKFHICLYADGKTFTLYGDEAQNFYDTLVSKEKSEDFGSIKELSGAIAYPGKKIGKVRVINKPEDIGKMATGDILVSLATTPSIVPAMKKAAAIVTDEGGLTCHAAIVSRELGITCVIGTKIATKVLKDGDLVEVDADNGVVRILDSKDDYFSLSNLTRLFSWSGFIPYLYSDRFVQSYIDLDGMAMSNPNIWLSYMSKQAEKRTQQEGVSLYADTDRYEQLKQAHQDTYNQTKSFMKTILETPRAAKKDVGGFLESANNYGKQYRWTEFFYTDLAFEQKEEQPQIAENFKTFEQFKLDGRQKLNDMFFVPDAFFAQVVNKLSSDFELPADDLLQYSMAELLSLFDGKQVAQEIIAERKKGYVIYAKDGATHSLTGNEALKVVSQFHQVNYEQKELKGTIASPGKVTGIAKVFKIDIKDYDKLGAVVDAMIPGHILIAETTEPSIIMACKKAAAIVTNQGGMMSHAAIVSRELKIPCLVGVVNATEIIPDGAKIEVDANKGTVKIL